MTEADRTNSPDEVHLLKGANKSRLPPSKLKNTRKIGSSFKRSRMEIMAQILSFCFQKRSKTRIMYATNINYAQLKGYLNFLTSQGLLTQNSGEYVIAEKGYRFLELYTQLNDLLKDNIHSFSGKTTNDCDE